MSRRTTAVRVLQRVLALATLLMSLAASEPVCFGQRTTDSEIGVRNAHALAYDSARNRVVLFGGADASKVCGETWEWNGSNWTRVSITGPEARTFPAMAYDSFRRKVVLFGGNRVLFGKSPDDNYYFNDTWEWNGRSWIQAKAKGPPPRAEAAMAFDSKRGRIVLFGGYNRTAGAVSRLGDTWEWDGKAWTQIKVAGPSPRSGTAMAYDDVRKRVILFGGQGASSGETWEWDGVSWKENNTTATEGRFNPVLSYDRARRRVVRFGGYYQGQRVGDTWGYEGKEWRLLSSAGPAARNHTAMVYDSRRKTIVLFGGHDGENVFGDTWEWDGSRWLLKEMGQVKKRVENGH